MAFVRRKNINGKDKYYLVESRREGDKVRQKVLAYLGEYDTVDGAITGLKNEIERHQYWLTRSTHKATEIKSMLNQYWIEKNGGEIPRPKKGMSYWASKPFRMYWAWIDIGESQAKWIEQKQNRLHLLRQHT